MRAYLRSLNPQLPRDVWILQAGGLANMFGNGVIGPFLIIYLHNVRGISTTLTIAIVAPRSAARRHAVSMACSDSTLSEIGTRRLRNPRARGMRSTLDARLLSPT